MFRRIANAATRWAGSPWAVLTAFAVIASWAISGPLFGFSDTWQLIINTGTTIVTFVMVFLIQATQNRDSVAIHLKLDAIIGGMRNISNAAVAIEEADEEELERLKQHRPQENHDD